MQPGEVGRNMASCSIVNVSETVGWRTSIFIPFPSSPSPHGPSQTRSWSLYYRQTSLCVTPLPSSFRPHEDTPACEIRSTDFVGTLWHCQQLHSRIPPLTAIDASPNLVEKKKFTSIMAQTRDFGWRFAGRQVHSVQDATRVQPYAL